MNNDIDLIRSKIIETCKRYPKSIDRTRRLFIEERAEALKESRDVEYSIKNDVSLFFGINYSAVSFTESAQLGYSIHKDRLFEKSTSDLDIACINSDLYQRAWIDIIDTTRAFTDETSFSGLSLREINSLKEHILRRGMILIKYLPRSELSKRWQAFEYTMTKRYKDHFRNISFAIYINEYAFCWKQHSSISLILEG